MIESAIVVVAPTLRAVRVDDHDIIHRKVGVFAVYATLGIRVDAIQSALKTT